MRSFTTAMLLVSLVGSLCACGDDQGPKGYTTVTPTDIPGVIVDVPEPLELTDNARFPQNDPSYERVEVAKDKLVFHYTSAPTIELAPGHVVAGGDPTGYLRKVVSVDVLDKKTVEVTTENATLGELILRGHFRVTQEPVATDWDNAGGDIASRTFALGPENNYSIFKEFGDSPALQCKVEAGASLKVEPVLDISPKLVLDVKFAPREHFYELVGEMVYAEFSIEGNVVAGVDITTKGELSASCETDFIGVLRSRTQNDQLFKIWLPTLRFAIGPVPVVITHYLEPIAKSKVEAKLTLASARASARLELGMKAGTKYQDGQWSAVWEPSRGGKLSFEVGEETGEASFSESLSVGFQYVGLIYSTAGPKIGLQLTGTETVKATPMTCEWGADLSFGVDLVYGAELQVPVLDKKIWDVSGKVELASTKITETSGPLPNCTLDAGPETAPDAGVDGAPDAATDATVDAGTDSGVDAPMDAPSSDGPPDLSAADLYVCVSDAGLGDAGMDDQDSDGIPDACDCKNNNVDITNLPLADHDDNPRTAHGHGCSDSEELVGVSLQINNTNPNYPSGYVDNLVAHCRDRCSGVITLYGAQAGTGYTYWNRVCPAGNKIVGVAYKDQSGSTPPDDFLDDLTLVCEPLAGGTRTVVPNAGLTASPAPWIRSECPSGWVSTGVIVKDSNGGITDEVDSVSARCRVGWW